MSNYRINDLWADRFGSSFIYDETLEQNQADILTDRDAKIGKMMEYCRKYMTEGDANPDTVHRMIYFAEICCFWSVVKAVQKCVHYTITDINDGLQEGSRGLMELMARMRSEYLRDPGFTLAPEFAWEVFKVYKNRATEVVKYNYNQMGEHANVDMSKLVVDAYGDLRLNGTVINVNPGSGMEEAYADAVIRSKLLHLYCQTMMDDDSIPPRPLALCYARMLYLLEHMYDPNEVDRLLTQAIRTRYRAGAEAHMNDGETRAPYPRTDTGLDWAIGRMEQKNLWELRTESEDALRDMVHRDLHWGPAFVDHLSQTPKGSELLWGSVVYTQAYQRQQISNWVESMEESVFSAAIERILDDEALTQEVVQRMSGKLEKNKKEQQRLKKLEKQIQKRGGFQ